MLNTHGAAGNPDILQSLTILNCSHHLAQCVLLFRNTIIITGRGVLDCVSAAEAERILEPDTLWPLASVKVKACLPWELQHLLIVTLFCKFLKVFWLPWCYLQVWCMPPMTPGAADLWLLMRVCLDASTFWLGTFFLLCQNCGLPVWWWSLQFGVVCGLLLSSCIRNSDTLQNVKH